VEHFLGGTIFVDFGERSIRVLLNDGENTLSKDCPHQDISVQNELHSCVPGLETHEQLAGQSTSPKKIAS
jgi:hypothetical protein